jgi:hypothetical protein
VTVLVIGQGAVGRALVTGLRKRKLPVRAESIRGLMAWVSEEDQTEIMRTTDAFSHIETVIYAGGPAGEAACRRDPIWAFQDHYRAVMDWVEWVGEPGGYGRRRLILIGTTSTAGFYGSLKQLALEHARDRTLPLSLSGNILALRCGQIIGPEMPVDGTGVVATWVRQAVRGEGLAVHDERRAPLQAALIPALEITLCTDLIERIATWLRAPITTTWEEERVCVPDPIPLATLATLCERAALNRLGANIPVYSGPDHPVCLALRGMAENAARALKTAS